MYMTKLMHNYCVYVCVCNMLMHDSVLYLCVTHIYEYDYVHCDHMYMKIHID